MNTFKKSLVSITLASAGISAFAAPITADYVPALDKEFNSRITVAEHPPNFVFDEKYSGLGTVEKLNEKAIRVRLESGKTIRLTDAEEHYNFHFVQGDKVQVTQTKPGDFELRIDGPEFVSVPVCANEKLGTDASDKLFTVTSTVVRDALLSQNGCFTQNVNNDFSGSAVTLIRNNPRGVFEVVLNGKKTALASFYVSRETAGNNPIAQK